MKVGDYARADFEMLNIQRICKIIKIISNDFFYTDIGYIDKEYIIKSSPNIIDLIEVGDYVNGHLVTKKTKDGFIWLEAYSKDGTLHYVDFINEWGDNIKSIVTKEQFESMMYEVK